MRISDWSSDVCSSDLARRFGEEEGLQLVVGDVADAEQAGIFQVDDEARARVGLRRHVDLQRPFVQIVADAVGGEIGRASCRERLCTTCRSRWSRCHSKKTQNRKITTLLKIKLP